MTRDVIDSLLLAVLMVVTQISCGYSDSLRPIPTGEEESEVTPDIVLVPVKAFKVVRAGYAKNDLSEECDEGLVVTVVCPETDNPYFYTIDDCGHLEPVYSDDPDFNGICDE